MGFLKGLRLRVWMPLAATLVLLLSVALMFLYGVAATESRVARYAQSFTLAEAAQTADALSEADREDWHRVLDRSVAAGGRQVLIVDSEGRVAAEAGAALLDSPPEEAARRAARGYRVQEERGGWRWPRCRLSTKAASSAGWC